MKRHIIYVYRGRVHQTEKDWDFDRIEKVLTRLGATYWDIEIGEFY